MLSLPFAIAISFLLLTSPPGSAYFPSPGVCPEGFFADGSCATLHLCIDPHERCINGICCEPADMFPSMPYGYNFGMPLGVNHFGPFGHELIPPRACMDLEESCLHFVQYCNVPSVVEVCIRSCGLCSGVGIGGGGVYAPYGGIGMPLAGAGK